MLWGNHLNRIKLKKKKKLQQCRESNLRFRHGNTIVTCTLVYPYLEAHYNFNVLLKLVPSQSMILKIQ